MAHSMTLTQKLEDAFTRYEDRPALEVGGSSYTYAELESLAHSTARSLPNNKANIGIFCGRNIQGFRGILACLQSGNTYVPLGPALPVDRLQFVCERATIQNVIWDGCEVKKLARLAETCTLKILTFNHAAGCQLSKLLNSQARAKTIIEIVPKSLERRSKPSHPCSDPEDLAYILFTSGTTGQPKGVGVTHRNVVSYLENIQTVLALEPEDRCSQTFELTFDLSVHDMFATWSNGACLCVASQNDLLFPHAYITDQRLTSWFSVPSLASQMNRMRQLTPDLYPGLRYGIFCGEALPALTAERFSLASPNARLFNLYGPTEATIAFTCFEYKSEASKGYSRGLVPIGFPLAGQTIRLYSDEKLKKGPTSQRLQGELVLIGDQVTPGYYLDAERTAKAFLSQDEPDSVGYHTGDIVEQDEDGLLHFVARKDLQVKIRGYRIEIAEIEAAIRRITNIDQLVVLPQSESGDGTFSHLVAVFLSEQYLDQKTVVEELRKYLPEYMLPLYFKYLEAFPKNSSGKVDRKAIDAQLD